MTTEVLAGDASSADEAARRIENENEEHRRARGDFIEGEGAAEEGEAAETAGEAAVEDKGKANGKGKAAAELSAEELAAVAGDEEVPLIPRARLNEVAGERDSEREKRIRAEAERDTLKALADGKGVAAEATKPVDVKALRRAYNEALIEGDVDKASELMGQIDDENIRIGSERAAAQYQATADKRDMDKTARELVKTYPFLDSTNDAERNMELIQDTLDLRDTYILRRGMSPADALETAAKKVGEPVRKERERAKKDAAAAGDKGGDAEAGKNRQQQAITRGVATGNGQPPRAEAGVGNRARGSLGGGGTEGIDVAKLSDEEFAKLPKEEKARLRGDVVE